MAQRPKISTKDLAEMFSVTEQHISVLCNKGVIKRIAHGEYDLRSSAAGYIKYLKASKAQRYGTDPDEHAEGDGITLTEARRRKAIKEVERLELINARERGELIPRTEVRDKCIQAGAMLVAELASIENDMPGQLEGAKAALIRDRLTSRFGIMVSRFREKLQNAETEFEFE